MCPVRSAAASLRPGRSARLPNAARYAPYPPHPCRPLTNARSSDRAPSRPLAPHGSEVPLRGHQILPTLGGTTLPVVRNTVHHDGSRACGRAVMIRWRSAALSASGNSWVRMVSSPPCTLLRYAAARYQTATRACVPGDFQGAHRLPGEHAYLIHEATRFSAFRPNICHCGHRFRISRAARSPGDHLRRYGYAPPLSHLVSHFFPSEPTQHQFCRGSSTHSTPP